MAKQYAPLAAYNVRVGGKAERIDAYTKGEARASLKKKLAGWKPGEPKAKWRRFQLPFELTLTKAGQYVPARRAA